jgi:hypothetical protein
MRWRLLVSRTHGKTARDLAEAERSLREAQGARESQQRKLETERKAVTTRLERLVQGNHLAELTLRALTERYDNEGA